MTDHIFHTQPTTAGTFSNDRPSVSCCLATPQWDEHGGGHGHQAKLKEACPVVQPPAGLWAHQHSAGVTNPLMLLVVMSCSLVMTVSFRDFPGRLTEICTYMLGTSTKPAALNPVMAMQPQRTLISANSHRSPGTVRVMVITCPLCHF